MLREQEGLAAQVLRRCGITEARVTTELLKIAGRGDPRLARASQQIPFTPEAKKVLERSLRQALSLGHNYIGTEHILLGLIDGGIGISHQILHTLYPNYQDSLRGETISQLSGVKKSTIGAVTAKEIAEGAITTEADLPPMSPSSVEEKRLRKALEVIAEMSDQTEARESRGLLLGINSIARFTLTNK